MSWFEALVALAGVSISLMLYGAYSTLREPKP